MGSEMCIRDSRDVLPQQTEPGIAIMHELRSGHFPRLGIRMAGRAVRRELTAVRAFVTIRAGHAQAAKLGPPQRSAGRRGAVALQTGDLIVLPQQLKLRIRIMGEIQVL